ncbi:hypothetical protein [Cellulosimicrobium sp. CUA-896]|uniref:hypothetical protein n=1 Tax=Cellulosimicrobium sp. CUA-896 TaxID=1517881 RepID=UPI00095E31EC|nr:hypothetical protein [Cellulosimicrobium sp. CUA-896]OLT47889.1 hypothetical protein BJF88_16975 [Cellulosimicrobium sp. CUA-896]
MTTTSGAPPTPGPDGDGPTPTDGSRRTWPWIVLTVVALLVVALVVWLVTRPADDAPDASPSPSPTETGETSPSPTEDPDDEEPDDTTSEPTTSPAAEGCPATGDGPPDGADTHEVVDVDGDGRPDTAWLTGGADRTFGITTASGATFSTPVESASPQPASAVVNLVAAGSGTAPIALVDTGREVLLLSAAGCALAPTANAQGEPYTFDKGFTGFGTGVGCTKTEDALRLAGLDAVTEDGTSFTVSRTFVELDADARTATNGQEETVATAAGPDDPVVTTAQEATCGDLVAGQDGPVEPRS